MSKLDFILSIPYRIIGVIVILICLIAAVPMAIPIILGLFTMNTTFKEAVSIGQDYFGKSSIKEILDIYKSGGLYLKIASVIIDKAILGFSMILAGLYYDEAYEYMMTA